MILVGHPGEAMLKTVEGSPETVAIGHEVLARIRHVQGVVAVRDRLVYPVLIVAPGPYILA